VPVSGSEVRISVRVHPNAATDEVVGFTDRILHVKVAAPPVRGKANKELVAFLSQILDIGKSEISVIKGHNARNKVIAVDGLSWPEILERLSPNQRIKLASSSSDASTG